MRNYGLVWTTNGMIVISSFLSVNSANRDLRMLLDKYESPRIIHYCMRNHEFAKAMSTNMIFCFCHLGRVVGGLLQIFLPLKLIFCWWTLFVVWVLWDNAKHFEFAILWVPVD